MVTKANINVDEVKDNAGKARVLRYPGLHCVRMPIAGGKMKAYYYAWRKGPRILGEPYTAFFDEQFRNYVGNVEKTREKLGRPVTDTLMLAIIEKLPLIGQTWTRMERERWRKTFDAVIIQLYGEDPL